MTARTSRRLGRRALQTLAVATASALALTGCSIGSGSGDGGPDGQSLTVDIPNFPATFDPAMQYDESSYVVYRNIYDQLLRRDAATLEPVPWIATEWENTDDETWVFQIREGVTFSDGTDLTADDVAFSIERILDPETASPQFANFSAIESATADSDTQLTITTDGPSPTLLSYLTTLSVVPSEAGDLNAEPVGSGAYVLDSQTSGSDVSLVRNEEYWGDEPAIDEVTFRAVPDASSRVSDLQSGTADLILGVTPDQATQLEGAADVQVLSAPTERIANLVLNVVGDTPTQNADLRRAIALAVNYDAIIDDLQGGYAQPIGTVLTPLAFGYPDDLPNYTYDPDEAARLVEESGADDLSLTFPTSPSFSSQIVQAVQSDLEAVGFDVTVENSDHATFLQKVQDPARDWGSVRFGSWSCGCLDADGVLNPLFHEGTVWSSYANPDFDALVDEANSTLDEGARQEAYAQAIDILNEDVAGIGLFQVEAIYAANSGLSWQPDATQSLYVDQMSLEG